MKQSVRASAHDYITHSPETTFQQKCLLWVWPQVSMRLQSHSNNNKSRKQEVNRVVRINMQQACNTCSKRYHRLLFICFRKACIHVVLCALDGFMVAADIKLRLLWWPVFVLAVYPYSVNVLHLWAAEITFHLTAKGIASCWFNSFDTTLPTTSGKAAHCTRDVMQQPPVFPLQIKLSFGQ